MSLLYSFSMLKNKISEDMDLVNEPFISDDELVGYMNEAIEEAETAVHTLGIEDTYFLATDFINFVSGQSYYSLPTDIYANKIRKFFYANPVTTVVTNGTTVVSTNTVSVVSATGLFPGMSVFGTGIPLTTKVYSVVGTTVTLSNSATASGTVPLTFVNPQPVYGAVRYEIRKIRNLEETQYAYQGNDYAFLIQNNPPSAGGNQLILYSAPNVSGPFGQMFYIREMRRLTTSTTDPFNVCELPECVNFIFQHVKWRISKKRRMPEIVAQEEATLKTQYTLLQETFKEMVPDGNNRVQMDLSSYYEQEVDRYF